MFVFIKWLTIYVLEYNLKFFEEVLYKHHNACFSQIKLKIFLQKKKYLLFCNIPMGGWDNRN